MTGIRWRKVSHLGSLPVRHFWEFFRPVHIYILSREIWCQSQLIFPLLLLYKYVL